MCIHCILYKWHILEGQNNFWGNVHKLRIHGHFLRKSYLFFWGGGWIFITFMGLLSLKVGTWTPKNLGRSSTPYGNCHDSDNAWYTHPSFRKKEEVLILELPHIALLTHSSDTFFYFWNCTVVENTMRWGINELWIIKNHDVYFHTKNVLGFKVAFSLQGRSIIAAPLLCGWDLLCGDMKGTKYAWGKDCETQWEKKEPLNYFSYSALWFAIIRNLVVVFKSKVWAAFMDEIIYTSGL